MKQSGSIAGQFEREFVLISWLNIDTNCLIRIKLQGDVFDA